MSSCCSVSAKSMICPRLRRVLVGFYSMVTRLGGLALVVLLVAGCGGGRAPPPCYLCLLHLRLPRHERPLPPGLCGFERGHPGGPVTHEPFPVAPHIQKQLSRVNLH